MNVASETNPRDLEGNQTAGELHIMSAKDDRQDLLARLRTQSRSLAAAMDDLSRRQREIQALRSALSSCRMGGERARVERSSDSPVVAHGGDRQNLPSSSLPHSETMEDVGSNVLTGAGLVAAGGTLVQVPDAVAVECHDGAETGQADEGPMVAILRRRILVMKRRTESAEDRLSRVVLERDRALLTAASTQGSLDAANEELARLARTLIRSDEERAEELRVAHRSIEARLASIEDRLSAFKTTEGIDANARTQNVTAGDRLLRLATVHRALIQLDPGAALDLLPHMQAKLGAFYEGSAWNVHRGAPLAHVLHGPYLRLVAGRYALHVGTGVMGGDAPELEVEALLIEAGAPMSVGTSTGVADGRFAVMFALQPGCENDEVEFRISHNGKADFVITELLLTRII